MSYFLQGDEVRTISFAPADEVKEVLQNVRTIITTVKHSVPMDREFGIEGTVIDLPLEVAKARMTNEIFRAIKIYEPRATVESVAFDGDENGRLVPTVEVSIKETGGLW